MLLMLGLTVLYELVLEVFIALNKKKVYECVFMYVFVL